MGQRLRNEGLHFNFALTFLHSHLSQAGEEFAESEKAQEEVLSLPIYPELGDDRIEEIVKAIESYDK